jgi:hypothetical protein
MAQGCILGQITVESGVNDQVDFKEGATAKGPGTVAAGDYFPDSATAGEDLVQKVLDQLNAEGAYTYFAEIDSDTGIVAYYTSDGSWQILNSTGYEDSIFLELGFTSANPTSTNISGNHTIFADVPPAGTWYPKTNRDGDERKWDSNWIYHGNGASRVGPTGKVVGITTGYYRTREITYSRIHATNAEGGLPRAQTCFAEHWYQQKVMRVFADRTITGTNYFDGKLTHAMKETWKPERYSASFETYEWMFEFIEVTS